MRISDWSSDVCSSELAKGLGAQDLRGLHQLEHGDRRKQRRPLEEGDEVVAERRHHRRDRLRDDDIAKGMVGAEIEGDGGFPLARSEEHTSELQSLMRISYAVFCLKKKKHENTKI